MKGRKPIVANALKTYLERKGIREYQHYTPDQILAVISEKFEPGMTVDNYGVGDGRWRLSTSPTLKPMWNTKKIAK